MAQYESSRPREPRKQSLFSLISSLPSILLELLRAEIDQLKADLAEKAKRFGIGAGLFIVALFFLFFALGVFTAAAVLGLAVVLPAWAAALIVGAALLLLAIVFGAIGARAISGGPDVPGDAIDRIRTDIDVVRGADLHEPRKREDS